MSTQNHFFNLRYKNVVQHSGAAVFADRAGGLYGCQKYSHMGQIMIWIIWLLTQETCAAIDHSNDTSRLPPGNMCYIIEITNVYALNDLGQDVGIGDLPDI